MEFDHRCWLCWWLNFAFPIQQMGCWSRFWQFFRWTETRQCHHLGMIFASHLDYALEGMDRFCHWIYISLLDLAKPNPGFHEQNGDVTIKSQIKNAEQIMRISRFDGHVKSCKVSRLDGSKPPWNPLVDSIRKHLKIRWAFDASCEKIYSGTR